MAELSEAPQWENINRALAIYAAGKTSDLVTLGIVAREFWILDALRLRTLRNDDKEREGK